jgi:hypothetical protein
LVIHLLPQLSHEQPGLLAHRQHLTFHVHLADHLMQQGIHPKQMSRGSLEHLYGLVLLALTIPSMVIFWGPLRKLPEKRNVL